MVGTPAQNARISHSHRAHSWWMYLQTPQHSEQHNIMMLLPSKHKVVPHPNYVRFGITFFNDKLYSKVYRNSFGFDSVFLKGKIFTWLEIISMFSEEFSPSLNFTDLEKLLFLCFFHTSVYSLLSNSCDCFIIVQVKILNEILHEMWDYCFSFQFALISYFFLCPIRFFWARRCGLYLHWNWMLGNHFPEQYNGYLSVGWKWIPSFFFLDNFDMGALLERIQQLICLGVLDCVCTARFCNQSLLPP